LTSLEGLAEPIDQDVQIEVGGADTQAAFTEQLLGAQPEEEKEFDLTYPEDYGQKKLAGKTVRFRIVPKTLRRKELPALDDEFARDLGDYHGLDELREAVKRNLFAEKQYLAQQKAKEELLDQLVAANQFPIPETYVDRQIENQIQIQIRDMTAHGMQVDPERIDWTKAKEAQREKAIRNVRASLIIEKVGEREGIRASQDEVDREVQRIARQEREPVAAVRARLQKDGVLERIAGNIQADKTLQFLFDHAQKHA
jgi:trigger factor